MSRPCNALWVSLVALLLSGCGGDDFADIKAYMAEVNAKPKGHIEPIPRFQAYEPFTYQASNLRSPFQPPIRVDVASKPKGSRLIKPDPNRVKQFLEGFNIEEFEMVGTLANQSGRFALIKGAGGVHRIRVGDYLGQNDGKVTAITDTEVDVVELVPDGEGGWIERPRSIPLKEHS
ncbi:pilus assembly protein PilP [Pseudomonas typographi]|uniref:pilus assembly protein PilP n=1 Tax=Pseudomonas typographi TaxID=2715964 RepID=UPI001688E50A|nr:pilus assembly protein PilP [Pseudomonas typographi]MBD1551833.1 pilus assembly protein PilP [Pseudomonas typographi]